MTRTTPSSSPLSAEVSWYLDSRGITPPKHPPLVRTPEPSGIPGAVFDPDRVDRVLKVFGKLEHTQGKWAGRPLSPDPWQVAYILAPVFGWVRPHPDDRERFVRIIRELYVEVPRKNGKTTTAGGIAIYLTSADGEAGAQVYAAATGERQARYCFDPIKAIAQRSKALKPHVIPLRDRIVHPRSASYFQVVSRVADLLHGGNVQGAIVDELHLHKSAELLQAIETGMMSRDQPLLVIITTAGSESEETLYARRHKRVKQLVKGVGTPDPTTYGVIWAAEEKDDPFAETTWEKANPGYPVSPTRTAMQKAAALAQQDPTELKKFLRLHLNIRTSLETKAIDLRTWDAAACLVADTALYRKPCWAGLDLSQTRDITAFQMIFPTLGLDESPIGPPFRVLSRFWIPEEAIEERQREDGVDYGVWVKQGLIRTTPGRTLHYDTIFRDIQGEAMRFAVQGIAFDPTYAWQLAQQLQGIGLEMVPYGQGFRVFGGPTSDFLALLKERQLQHGGNPVLRWMADNTVFESDVAGNWRPSKRRSTARIDGIVATIMGIDLAQRWLYASDEAADDEVLVYEERVEIGPRI